MGLNIPSDLKRKEYQDKRQNILLSFQRNEIDEEEYQKLLFNLDFNWVLIHFSKEEQILLRDYFEKMELTSNLNEIRKKNTKLTSIFNKSQKFALKQVLEDI